MVRDRARSAAGYPQLREEGVVKSTRTGARRLDLIPPYLFAELDPATEILPTLGSKDGISHAPLALVDPGEVVLTPDPGYTVYVTGAVMAGAEPYVMPLTESNHWLPDLDAIPAGVLDRARLMWLNYPNNPTAATADRDFLQRAVEFCRRHEIVLCHDAPYSEIAFDGYRPLTLFET